MPEGKEVEEEEGNGNGEGCSPERECVCAGSFVLRLLSLSCRQDLRGGLRRGFG